MAHEEGRARASAVARERLHQALARRDGEPIGTPLQELYAADYPAPTRTTATTFWGETMQVVLPELVSCELHRHGVIEPGVTAFFLKAVSPGSVVYDVGAHLGYYSLLASYLGGEVHAFEPSRATLPLLRRNVGSRAVVSACGLWSAETTRTLQDFGDAHSAVNTFLSPKDAEVGEPQVTYAASLTTIDRYVEDSGAVPQLIKVDAEGAELEVLRGAERTMTTVKPPITVEVGDTGHTEGSRRAIDLAVGLGYTPFEMTIAGTRPHQVREIYGYDNILLA